MFQVILKVDWFRAEYKGSRATMRLEPSGFWSVDSTKLLRATKEPYILPAHCQQAFFYKNPNPLESSWWQIIHINPRGRRIFDSSSQILNTISVLDDGEELETHDMVSLNPLEVTKNQQNEEQEDNENEGQEDTEDEEPEENEDEEQEDIDIPIDVTEEEHQELIQDTEVSNLYIEIYSEESP